MKCKCDMRTKLLGDGCEACNPQLALDMALGAYWEAAVAEGANGRDHDTPDGDAQRALEAVHSAVAAMVTAERETARGLNLELDLRRAQRVRTSAGLAIMRELSLRPYHGRLFIVKTAKGYERAHKKLFKTPDVLSCAQEGRFSGGEGNDGMWTYLIWRKEPHTLAHEMAHVLLHLFERCGIDPREAGGDPFCYMLSQLLLEAGS